jgi:hypothetical protein
MSKKSTRRQILDAWKSGEALSAPIDWLNKEIDIRRQPRKTRQAQDKMIKKYVDKKVGDDVRDNWEGQDKSMSKIIKAHRDKDTEIKGALRAKGIYKPSKTQKARRRIYGHYSS